MNILYKAAGVLAFSAVLAAGTIYLAGNRSKTTIPGDVLPDVYAEETSPFAKYSAGSSLETLPISDFGGEIVTETCRVTFSFMGDCILASNAGDTREDAFAEYAKQQPPSYFFENAVPLYSESDFVVANSEFVMSDRDLSRTISEGREFWFKAPVSSAQILKEGQIDIVSIANNHTSDYGDEGYADTKAALEDAGIIWGDLDNPVYVKKNGITFGIICTKLFSPDVEPFIDTIAEKVMENSDIQIMYFHGGEENSHVPEEWLVDACHRYADMGIDLIVGSHPHVLRPMEEYNGVDIIYSLGNFCYGGNRTPENRTVMLNESFVFDVDGEYIYQEEEFIPFYVYGGEHNNWQPVPISDPGEISRTIAFMYGSCDTAPDYKGEE